MSKSVNILRGDLHLMVSAAFTRGRYVLMTGGDGQPQEITIDLRERPDDLFDCEPLTDEQKEAFREKWTRAANPRREDIGKWKRLDDFLATDDHGPAIPAQDHHYSSPDFSIEARADGPYAVPTGPRVYEFALQDVNADRPAPMLALTLPLVVQSDAPDQAAFIAADWVHVYDRVTRERRTLKRPAPSNLETGLRRLAEGLRGSFRPEDATHVETSPPLPPVGPLTSTEGLRAGDVLRSLTDVETCRSIGYIATVLRVDRGEIHYTDRQPCPVHSSDASTFAFVGRPDADGWMTWAGGENPVGDATVDVIFRDGAHLIATGTMLEPFWPKKDGNEAIDRFRIVDSKGGTTDT